MEAPCLISRLRTLSSVESADGESAYLCTYIDTSELSLISTQPLHPLRPSCVWGGRGGGGGGGGPQRDGGGVRICVVVSTTAPPTPPPPPPPFPTHPATPPNPTNPPTGLSKHPCFPQQPPTQLPRRPEHPEHPELPPCLASPLTAQHSTAQHTAQHSLLLLHRYIHPPLEARALSSPPLYSLSRLVYEYNAVITPTMQD